MSFDSELPNGWYWSILDDVKAVGRSVVSGPFGSNIGKRFFVESGVPVIRGNNLTTGMDRFNDNGFVFLTEEKAKEFTACEAVAGDLIFTAAGTIGQVGIIPKDAKYQKYIISNKQLRARLDSEKIDPTFAFYWFASPAMVQTIQSRNTGSTIPLINLSVLKSLSIPVPPLKEQRVIAEYLSTLDDRITLLRETNATLEAIAQALFKSWFVDFDPVRAKMEGRAPEGMIDATAALFPDGFEESELGLVPRGWRAGSLTDLSTLNPESWTAKKHPDSVAYIDLANAKENEIAAITEYPFDEAPSRARRVLRDGDTIVGTVRPGNRSFAFIHQPASNLTASTGFAVLRPKCAQNTEFVYLAATADFSIEHLAHVADGAAYPAVRPEVVAGLNCIVPTDAVMSAFHKVIAPLLAKVADSQQQAQTLASLRDTLLPRLISGQLRLPEAEALIA
ncbi:restriction endonuclease subunit S [Chromobacterium phragmitis]|uniref:restriction endonuclease subunit S n=1 Tax=Chromobacterium phragmitis TaxID=2202141 RepID=UPI000DED35CE|nr:restriction endonuclease subunit S [Chromobacterium phragmitis]AXE32268.1 restriction endonuclease subunit S [Chromobacterium phragmitis]